MKENVNHLEEKCKNKNIPEMYKDINEFKNCSQPRTYLIMKHGGTIVADTTSTLSRWEQLFGNLLNVNQRTSHERSEVNTKESDIPEPSLKEVELAIEKFKRHKATRVDHIPSELIQAGGGKLYKETHCTHLEQGRIATRMERIHYCSNS